MVTGHFTSEHRLNVVTDIGYKQSMKVGDLNQLHNLIPINAKLPLIPHPTAAMLLLSNKDRGFKA